MKTLLGILIVASSIGATATAQQNNDQQISPNLRAKIEALVKARSQEPVPTSDDKIEGGLVRKQGTSAGLFSGSIIVIEGAVYTSIGDMLMPLPGGGASGCFDPNAAAKIERARAEWAKRQKKD